MLSYYVVKQGICILLPIRAAARRAIVLVSAAVALVASQTPVAAAAPGTIQVVSDGVRMEREANPPEESYLWDPRSGIASLHGGRNEVVSFQILLYARKETLPQIRVRLTVPLALDSSHAIPARNVQFFREHYVKVATPSHSDGSVSGRRGCFPEALVPEGAMAYGFPFDLQPGNRLEAVWVDVWIPEEAKPGNYLGQLAVESAGREIETIHLNLIVWRFALPRQTHFKSLALAQFDQIAWAHGVRVGSPENFELEAKYYRMAHDHRLSLSYDSLSARYAKFMTGEAFPEGPCRNVGNHYICAARPDKWAAEDARKILAQCEELGVSRQAFIHLGEEFKEKAQYDAVRQASETIRSAIDRKLKLLVGVSPVPRRPGTGTLWGCVDIWDGVYAPEDMKVVRERQQAGDEIWFYGGLGARGNPSIDGATPLDVRALPYFGLKYGFTCYEQWETCYFANRSYDPDKTHRTEEYLRRLWRDPLNFDESVKTGPKWCIQKNGDGMFFYPGKAAGVEGPIATITLKAFRRGVQDCEYLWMLVRQGEQPFAAAMVSDLLRSAGPSPADNDSVYERFNPAPWEKKRVEAARKLDGVWKE